MKSPHWPGVGRYIGGVNEFNTVLEGDIVRFIPDDKDKYSKEWNDLILASEAQERKHYKD